MQTFQYKNGFIGSQAVGVSKELITYKGKNYPAASITGVGIELIPVSRMAMSGAMGGAIGGLISYKMTKNKYKDFEPEPNKNANLHNLPDKRAMLLIAHQDNPQSKKNVVRIPLNTTEPQCKTMMEEIKKEYGDKWVGVGMPGKVQKILGISMKGAIIFITIFIILIVGAIAYIAISDGLNY